MVLGNSREGMNSMTVGNSKGLKANAALEIPGRGRRTSLKVYIIKLFESIIKIYKI